jgi:hypothetical protein
MTKHIRIFFIFLALSLSLISCDALFPEAGLDEPAVGQPATAVKQPTDVVDTNDGGEQNDEPVSQDDDAVPETATMTPESTDLPVATDTPMPTATATLVPTHTPVVPIIGVTENTNCRYGPGVVYDPPVDVFEVGETAEVYGRDGGSDFYYISLGCWVWSNYVFLIGGNLNAVPVMTPPPTPTATPEPGPWAGVWESQCGADECGTMILTQDGNVVTGSYADGDGSIDALVDPSNENHLLGSYNRGGSVGSFDFWFNASGQKWRGNWNGTRAWCGARSGLALPTECGVASWYGTWETNCTAGTCDTMVLEQDGLNVWGTYANGTRTISGLVTDVTKLLGTWTFGGSEGTFGFSMISNHDQFNGNYSDGVGFWCGKRNGSGYPNPCLMIVVP